MYVLIKILKYCTGSSAKSYQCKFTFNDVLRNRDVSDVEELGDIIQKVIHHYTLRGKFSSIHPELRREGIIRVEVGKEGLHFIRNSGALRSFILSSSNFEEKKKDEILPLGDAVEDVRESTMCLVVNKDQNKEEELLSQAIALSLENEIEEDEEELLRQAIALSLED